MPAKSAKKPSGLRISETLSLPIESVTETFAVLGRRGSGKTNTAVVMVEEMIGAGMPTVVVDPVGVWWGLRSSADGKGDGLPVVIFGGDHADVPLTDKAGEVVADAVIDGRFPAILDLSAMSKGAMRRFMTDFAVRLYHANREALHLVIDEADMLAPQRLQADGLRLFGAVDDIQRRGRTRGIGTTLITQRPAVLNKDLLSQAEVLVALQMTNARDVAAIDEWVSLNAEEGQAKAVKSSLASLPVGTAWVWSPMLLDTLDKVAVRRRETFDSSATPKPGESRPVAQAFASVDTEALGARIDALVEEAAAADPKALRAKVTRLEKALTVAEASTAKAVEQATRQATKDAPAPDPIIEEVKVPFLTEEQAKTLDTSTEAVRTYAANCMQRTENAVSEIRAEASKIEAMLAEVRALAEQKPPTRQAARPSRGQGVIDADATQGRARRAVSTKKTVSARPTPPIGNGAGGSGDLPKAERLVLTALAQHGTLATGRLAIITGYSVAGGFKNALSRLRTNGWIDGAGTGTASITEEGLAVIGDFERLPEGDALLEWWMEHGRQGKRLGQAERMILTVLREAFPEHIGTAELAERTGYSVAGGFKNSISRLRSLGLAEGKGGLTLSEDLVG